MKIKRDRGFTLLEMLIAITILMFSMLAIVPFMVTAVSVDTSTSVRSRAQMYAIERLSQLQFIPEDNIPSECIDPDNLCFDNEETFKGTTLARSYKFNRVLITGPTMQPSYIITVFVSYPFKGQIKQVFFTAPWIRK